MSPGDSQSGGFAMSVKVIGEDRVYVVRVPGTFGLYLHVFGLSSIDPITLNQDWIRDNDNEAFVSICMGGEMDSPEIGFVVIPTDSTEPKCVVGKDHLL
jgi:hypothetical protein